MRARQIDTSIRNDVRRFVEFPFQLYRDCPQWVPPLLSSSYKELNPAKHPFYEHSEAAFFIVEQDGCVVAKIAAINNRNFNKAHESKTAFFGQFEAIDDSAVSDVAFNAVFDWARERGLTEMVGPKGLSPINSGGVLVEGFEHRPALGIAYNYPYYDKLVRHAGFEKDTDYLSGYICKGHVLPERIRKIAERAKERRGYWIKTFKSRGEMWRWVPRVMEVHRKAFSWMDGYVKPTESEAAMIAAELISVAKPDLLKLVMKDSDVVGFVFVYPDISEGLQKARGRLFPFGWYHIMQAGRKTKWLSFNGVGLIPGHQGVGANAVMYSELEKTLASYSYEEGDLALIDEKNFRSKSDHESVGVKWYKAHRRYRRAL